MSFNELNSVEHFIIHQLTGLDLNAMKVSEDKATYGLQWVYK
jgi:type I restriction enzyme R subunit